VLRERTLKEQGCARNSIRITKNNFFNTPMNNTLNPPHLRWVTWHSSLVAAWQCSPINGHVTVSSRDSTTPFVPCLQRKKGTILACSRVHRARKQAPVRRCPPSSDGSILDLHQNTSDHFLLIKSPNRSRLLPYSNIQFFIGTVS
jgi:hypothetical protein